MKLTIIAIILCVSLGAKAQQDSTEMKKAIDAMQKMYSVHFVYDSSLANIKPKGIFQRSSSLPENLKKDFQRNRHPMGDSGRICPAVPPEQLYFFRPHMRG